MVENRTNTPHVMSVEQFRSREGCKAGLDAAVSFLSKGAIPAFAAAYIGMEEQGLSAQINLTVNGLVEDVVMEKMNNHTEYTGDLPIKSFTIVLLDTPRVTLNIDQVQEVVDPQNGEISYKSEPRIRAEATPDDLRFTFYRNGKPSSYSDFFAEDFEKDKYQEALNTISSLSSQ